MPPIDTTYYPDGTALHLWQVTEDITALMECCKNLGITPPNTMNCTKRMKEKLIEALLLHHIFGKIVTLGHTQSGAPTIDIDRCHISISHTSGWIAIAKNYNHNIGIDIERCSSRILRVREKFLNTQELAFIAHDDIIENTLVEKSVRNDANRLANCDNANVDKIVEAAMKQVQAIAKIEHPHQALG